MTLATSYGTGMVDFISQSHTKPLPHQTDQLGHGLDEGFQGNHLEDQSFAMDWGYFEESQGGDSS